MKTYRGMMTAAAATALCMGGAVQAQSVRTFVSGVGDDANPCSRTAPCRTFGNALLKTTAGGEINCLDAGAYSSVVINKSITIDCTGTLASISTSSGVEGVFISDSAQSFPGSIRVVLRGLSISPGTGSGLAGIRFTSGLSLVVRDVEIKNMSLGSGIAFAPITAAILTVINSAIINNGNSGVAVRPTNAGNANVTLENVMFVGNADAGLTVDTTGLSGSSTNVTASNTLFAGSKNGISVTGPAGTPGASVTITNSKVTGNLINGLLATGPNSRIFVSNSSIAGNTTGVTSSGGGIGTFGDNVFIGNGSPGAFTGSVPKN